MVIPPVFFINALLDESDAIVCSDLFTKKKALRIEGTAQIFLDPSSQSIAH